MKRKRESRVLVGFREEMGGMSLAPFGSINNYSEETRVSNLKKHVEESIVLLNINFSFTSNVTEMSS